MQRSERLRSDIISNLPDHVIDNILSCLPLGDAVRTSVLSREWRYRWMYNPVLVFNFRFTFLRSHKLATIIYRILLHHQGPINKFALSVPSYNLGHLNLYRCVFRPPSEFKGFSRLVTLSCQDVDFVPTVVVHFISQCTMLERVQLVNCTDQISLEVEGPSLRFFTFDGVFKSICFKNCPVLDEVMLTTPSIVHKNFCELPACIKSIDFHPTLRKLCLHPRMLEVLAVAGLPNQLTHSLNYLKVLDISMYLDTIEEISCALCLIRSAPNLEMLRIAFYVEKTLENIVEFLWAQEAPDHYLNLLRRVEIRRFTGAKPEMEFAKYLLASAAGLVVMEMAILPQCRSFYEQLSCMINQLQHYPKASPSAQVVPMKGNRGR